jgi:hypothetical protein
MFPRWRLTQKRLTRRAGGPGPGMRRTRFEGYRLVAGLRRSTVVRRIKHCQCFGNAVSLLGIETGRREDEQDRDQREAARVSNRVGESKEQQACLKRAAGANGSANSANWSGRAVKLHYFDGASRIRAGWLVRPPAAAISSS